MGTAISPKVAHIRAKGLSLVFDLQSGAIPRLVYWGEELEDETAASLSDLVVASREPLEGNAPDEVSRTGIIPLESDGWTGRPGLSGFRDGGTAWAPRFTLVDAQFSDDATHLSEDVVASGPGITKFELVDDRSSLRLSITLEVFAEGVARFQGVLKNEGETAYHLEELGFALPVPLQANELLDTTGRWGRERSPQRRPISFGCDLREGRHGRTGFDAPGMSFVGKSGFGFRSGEIWGLHTAFSGNHRTWVEKMPTGEQVIGGSELLLPGEMTLKPEQEYSSPWIFVQYAEGLDDAANRIVAWSRNNGGSVDPNRPVTLNVWEAVYFNHDLERLQGLAHLAKEIGVERFVLDDGWFLGRRNDWAGLGDWVADPDVWPKGLTPLSNYVHDLGMQFGLWFEPEMINLDSELARNHPDWILGAQGSSAPEDLPLAWRHQQVLNIAIPEARKYVEDAVVKAVHDFEVDYIKWDHNRDLIEAGDLTQGGRAVVDAQTRAYYRLVDDIKARCPGLEIESCSSGGGRIDLEVLQHTDRVWVSDCIDPVERQSIVRWLSQLVAPELMGTHVASPVSHTTGRTSNMALRGATAIWGHFGIEWDISSADPREIEELAEWIAFYKENREFLLTGQMVREDGPDETIWISGVVSPNKSRALYQVVSRGRSPMSPRGRSHLPGLDPAKRYRVRPIIVGAPPSGLFAPQWFGVRNKEHDSTNQTPFDASHEFPGVVLTGGALAHAGLQTPRLHPDQALLISVEEEA